MATPSEAQPSEGKNQQAIASLVLGIVSLVLFFLIGVVGIFAGLLALYAGVRGLRFAKQLEGRGQILAIAGMGLGVLGIVINAMPIVLGARAGIQLSEQLGADATHTALLSSEAPQTYQGDGFTLAYHADWQIPDFSQLEQCQQPGFECLLIIGHPANDGTNIGLMRLGLPSEFDAEELYAMIKADLETVPPDTILDGPELFEINGIPAVRVILTLRGGSAGEVTQSLQVSIARGLDLYLITAYAPNAEAFKNHQAELEEIVSSFRFTP